MRTTQISIEEILGVLRRRRPFFFLPAFAVIFLSIIGAVLLPRRYESSTTILAQRDEVLNPLLNYTMAVATASDDRLRTFNEIIFSSTAVQTLIDSLNLGRSGMSEDEKQELMKSVRKNISADRPGAATFRVSYVDNDPVRAWRGVSVLANYFIATVLEVENKRNELAVEFFEKKLEDLRQKFEVQQKDVVSLMRSRIQEQPLENRALWGNMEDFDKDVGKIEDQIKVDKRALALIDQSTPDLSADSNRRMLFELQSLPVPHATDLKPLVMKYDEYSLRYTAKFPEVRKLTGQISELLGVMHTALQADIEQQVKSRDEIERKRSQSVEDLKQSSAYQEMDKDKKSSFDIARNLYDEMKIKLEQARTTRDLGKKGSEEFTLIDPPIIPTKPTKPNRSLLVGGGAGLGLLIGVISAALAELLDPTIRSVRDITVYRKRVIAFIPQTTNGGRD